MQANEIKKIGKYDVLDVLGQGGMGIVYKAVDPAIGRKVAIKMMTGGFAENPDLLKRFQREAQSAGALQHPNIVIIYELGTHENGNPYMAMEFIDGESLESIVANRKRMSLVDKLGIMIQLLNGLQYAHAHGIVHRDVKPANVMVLKDGSIKIVDFGIARISDNSMTKTGQIVGTINYMSPEQFNGHVVDGRSDIFSSGVLLYEFLTGALPFDGAETPSVILKILNDPPPPLKEHLQNFPPELEECLLRALSKDREERYGTAEDFAFDLARIQESLKKEMVVEYVDQAKQLFDKKELAKAKDLLQQVLRVDTKNITAQDLMKQVQQLLSVQQRGEQIKQLRANAEDALAQKMIDDALSYCQQALKMDPQNAELLNLQKMIQQAKARKDQIAKSIRRAEDLKADGDFDGALKVADEAVALDPKDTSAKNIRDVIAAEIKKLQAQKELQVLLDQARAEISQRRFTKAIELIRKSENVAPGATQAGSLRNVLNTAREHEAQRIAIDKVLIEAEVALHRESLQAAQTKLQAALKKFPGDDKLQELSNVAEELRQAAGLGDPEKIGPRAEQLAADDNYQPLIAMVEHALKAAPDARLKEMLAEAQKASAEFDKKAQAITADADRLFKAGKVDEAVSKMEEAPASCTRVAAYLALLEKARAEQDKQGGIEVGVIEARKLMDKGDVTGAWNKAKAIMQANPQSQMVQGFMKELETKRVAVAKESVEKAIKDARALLLARQASAANRTLQGVAAFLQHVPPDLQKQYTALQKEVAGGSQQQINADMNQTMVAGSTGRASGSAAAAAPAQAPVQQQRPAPAPVIPQKEFPTKAVASVVLLIVLGVGGWFGYQKFFGPLPITTYAEINATPYATVTRITSADGRFKKELNVETPVRVDLPAGTFTVEFKGPNGETATETLSNVAAGSPATVTHPFEAVSANEIVKTSN
jgi:serine/threonine-protein kinase